MGRTLAAGASPPWEVVEMGIMEFEVCRRGRDARWVVRIGASVYGAYLDKEQRSEERRVGKECRCRWARYPEKKKNLLKQSDRGHDVTRMCRDYARMYG